MKANTAKTLIPARFMPFLICGLGSLFYLYDFFLRVAPSVMTNELMGDLGVDARALGLMSGFFFYGYAPMQIPSGMLMDRFGPRAILTWSAAICTMGTFLFGITTSYELVLLGRFLIGFGSAAAYIGALVLAARWYDAKYFALIAGLVQLLGSVGAIGAEAPLAAAVDHSGWQTVTLWSAAVGLFLTCLFWKYIKDFPGRADESAPQIKSLGMINSLRVLCRNPQNWWTGLVGLATWTPVDLFAAFWGVPCLERIHHLSETMAATACSMIWVGVGVMSPVVGWWSNYIEKRCLPLIASSLIGAVSVTMILYTPHLSLFALFILLFLFGAGSAAQALTFGVVRDNNSPNVAGVAVGFNNMAVVLGAAIFHPVVGWIIRQHWDGAYDSHHVPIYTATDYQVALAMVPLFFVLAGIVTLFFLRETRCRFQYQTEE